MTRSERSAAWVACLDGWSIAGVATRSRAFAGNPEVLGFEGYWQGYEAGRKGRLGKEADQPQRIITRRKLTG